MKREIISLALNQLDDRHISDTAVFSPRASERPSERTFHMKKKNLITFAIAAVLLLSLSIAAYAIAGIPRWTATHSMPDTKEYFSLKDLPEVKKSVGYEFVLPEAFSNGYAFSSMRTDGEAVYDEDQHLLKEYYVVHATYSATGREDLLLSLSPVQDYPGSQEAPPPTATDMIGTQEVKLYRDHYKFVPEDYEKTEDDLSAEASGHYYISFGAEEIKEKDILSADFDLQGVHYNLLSLDAADLTADDLFRMASEIISLSGTSK